MPPTNTVAIVIGLVVATVVYFLFSHKEEQKKNCHENYTYGNVHQPGSDTHPRRRDQSPINSQICTICYEQIRVTPVQLKPCGHVFHKECFLELKLRNERQCPNCRRPFIN